MMLNQKCMIYRNTISKGNLNRPQTSTESFGPFPCTTSLPLKNRLNYEQGTPQADISIDLVLYASIKINLKEGDIVRVPVQVDQITKEVVLDGSEIYVAGKPYRPRNHHTECTITLQRSV